MAVWSRRRAGSSRWELVLGVLIFLVLGSVLVPGVLKVRELSHRVECQARLKRLGQALMSHHDLRGVFPSVGGHLDEANYLVLTRPDGTAAGQRLGLGSVGVAPEDQPGSWIYQLLPHFDAAAARAVTPGQPTGLGLGIKDLGCPSRGRPPLLSTPECDPLFPKVRYSSMPAGQFLWGRTDYAANGRLLPPRGDPLVRFSNFKPGLANAILVGEKALDTRGYTTGGWLQDGPALVGGATSVRTATSLHRDAADPCLDVQSPAVNGWGSPHSVGTHFLFASGHVRLVRHTLSDELLGRLMGPSNALPNLD
jgi:hypothetical protein